MRGIEPDASARNRLQLRAGHPSSRLARRVLRRPRFHRRTRSAGYRNPSQYALVEVLAGAGGELADILASSTLTVLEDSPVVTIRRARPDDRPVLEGFLKRWHSLRVARRGEVVHPLDFPQLLAERDGEIVGVLTYVVDGPACEILTLHADDRRKGVGTALIDEVKRVARDAGCTRLCVITTNDNVDALRFYQRRDFRLAELRAGAVDDSRARLKPEIPVIGNHGIPLRDEIELEQDL